jgi:hypothetical protein
MKADPWIEILGLQWCEIEADCDFCNSPDKGVYSQSSGLYEYPDECDFCICGKCVVENQTRNRGRFNRDDLVHLGKLPF